MKIILDTNFLVYCAKNKLDYAEDLPKLIIEKYDLVVPLQVMEELKKITQKTKLPVKKRTPRFKKTTGKDKLAADLALQILENHIKNKKIKKVDLKGISVDDAIIQLAKTDSKNIVCTLDREMRFILKRVILINRLKRLILTK